MNNTAIDNLIRSCDLLQQRTIIHEGCMHSSVRCFDSCMRAFDRKVLPAEALTFRVFFNVPVMKLGFARIHKDGSMQMWTGDDPNKND